MIGGVYTYFEFDRRANVDLDDVKDLNKDTKIDLVGADRQFYTRIIRVTESRNHMWYAVKFPNSSIVDEYSTTLDNSHVDIEIFKTTVPKFTSIVSKASDSIPNQRLDSFRIESG